MNLYQCIAFSVLIIGVTSCSAISEYGRYMSKQQQVIISQQPVPVFDNKKAAQAIDCLAKEQGERHD